MSTLENLTAQHAEVKAEIARTDTKTALLLAFVGAVAAGAWTVARDLPLTLPAYIAGEIGLAFLIVAAGLLLRSVRPNLGGGHGFPLWATLTPDQLVATATARDLAADVVGLSRLAVAKFTCLRHAVDLVLAGGALLILSALIALGGS
ncbi:MAG: integral membrane plasmid transfer protein [Streptomyces sp.]|nr:integral membrane plasmid transfer protein [Streptomyces sp.]NUR66955.1 integral membrane plasmid transfer protein [Streptomyces sp.]NUS75925.1 integral membrane plasmid transfer protein [Streptomyces sp.]